MGDEDPDNRIPVVGKLRLFFSGLITPGEGVTGYPEEQARVLIEKYASFIESVGGVASDVVHVTIYVKKNVDPRHLLAEYSEAVKGLPPALTIVWVEDLPGQASYALSLIACLEG